MDQWEEREENFGGKNWSERDDWLGGNLEGRMTCEDAGKTWRGLEGPWEGRTQRVESREERGDWGKW